VSAHAPTVPATRHRFRAEHLTAIVVAALAIFAISAGTSSLPHGTPVGTTCAWHGSRLVVSGGVINTGMSSGQFRTNVRMAIAGRPRPVYRSAFTDLGAFSAGRFTATYRSAHKGIVGNASAACTARVVTIPPPSGQD
jgi:hypothetical protein